MTSALEITTILELLSTIDNNDWDNIKTAEDSRRILLHAYHQSFEPKPATKAPHFPATGQRVQFATTVRPMRISGRTGVVTEILAKDNVKIKVDGTNEVFTRVPASMYTIIGDDVPTVVATQVRQRRSRY